MLRDQTPCFYGLDLINNNVWPCFTQVAVTRPLKYHAIWPL